MRSGLEQVPRRLDNKELYNKLIHRFGGWIYYCSSSTSSECRQQQREDADGLRDQITSQLAQFLPNNWCSPTFAMEYLIDSLAHFFDDVGSRNEFEHIRRNATFLFTLLRDRIQVTEIDQDIKRTLNSILSFENAMAIFLDDDVPQRPEIISESFMCKLHALHVRVVGLLPLPRLQDFSENRLLLLGMRDRLEATGGDVLVINAVLKTFKKQVENFNVDLRGDFGMTLWRFIRGLNSTKLFNRVYYLFKSIMIHLVIYNRPFIFLAAAGYVAAYIT